MPEAVKLNDAPLVSILLLSWNHEQFIEQCISSLQKQTYRAIEVVYVDNGSTDGTYEKGVALLKATGLPFRSFQNKEGKGISANFNFLLKQSEGALVIPLSTDDWLHPDCIQKKVDYYQQRPHTGMLYSGGWIYFEDQKKFVEADGANFRRGRITKELLMEEQVLFFIGICYRRSVLEELGGWDEALLIEDMDMFIRISQRYEIDYIAEPLVYYRKINSSAANNVDFMIKGWEQLYEKYKDASFVNMRHWLGEKYRAYAALSLDFGDKKKAVLLLRKSFWCRPLNGKALRTLVYLIRKSA